MRIKNKKTYYQKLKTVVTDREGGKYPGYSSEAKEIKANIWPASGKLQAEMYGLRINNILNMLYDGNIAITESDGICVYVDSQSEPDYKVISKKEYSHGVYELEKI
jgi:hypothetical protein